MLKGYDTNYDDKIAPAKPVVCVLPLEEVQQNIELRTRLRRCLISIDIMIRSDMIIRSDKMIRSDMMIRSDP